jgi:hypothetical protein
MAIRNSEHILVQELVQILDCSILLMISSHSILKISICIRQWDPPGISLFGALETEIFSLWGRGWREKLPRRNFGAGIDE